MVDVDMAVLDKNASKLLEFKSIDVQVSIPVSKDD